MNRPIGPPTARRIQVLGAWVVGSSALSGRVERDLDLMVPWALWSTVALLVPRGAAPNSFGGWSFVEDGVTVDVWPDTLDRLAAMDAFRAAWHPLTGARVVRAEAP